jgi:hypothetical protein
MKQREFLEHSISFFKKTGLDPRKKTDFQSETNRLIGFLKVQDDNAIKHFKSQNTRITTIERVVSDQTESLDTLIELQKTLLNHLTNQ